MIYVPAMTCLISVQEKVLVLNFRSLKKLTFSIWILGSISSRLAFQISVVIYASKLNCLLDLYFIYMNKGLES